MIASLGVAIVAILVAGMAVADQARSAEPRFEAAVLGDVDAVEPVLDLLAPSGRDGSDDADRDPAAGTEGDPEWEQRVAEAFGQRHADARQGSDPASRHWAVLIGVGEYRATGLGDTLGSVADAHVLRDTLLAAGWRDEHVLVLTDAEATRDRIVLALEWLAMRTTEDSTAVVSYSGHADHDGHDTALWGTHGGRVWTDELGALLGNVGAHRAWFTFQGCHAAGLAGDGVEGPGRVVTYSSARHEKSFEDPETGHSVMGGYLLAEGLRDRRGASAGSPPSVQGAFDWAADRAHTRTAGQQTPQMADGLGEPFTLEVAP